MCFVFRFRPSGGGARIAGLRDIPAQPSGGNGHTQPKPKPPGGPGAGADEDDEPQSFFAGGERSGISVEGPAKGTKNQLVRDILKKAQQGGPAQAPEASQQPSFTFFTGGGNTLGSDEVPSSFVPDPNAPVEDGEGEESEETAIRNITFWRDGFSVEDGPLLRYEVPENAQLLGEINTGHAPPSVLNVRVGQPVELRVARRMDEDYKEPPKRPVGPFESAGQRLGDFSPVVTGVERPSSSTASQTVPGAFPVGAYGAPVAPTRPAASSRAADVPLGQPRFEVDQTQPTTSVQVRLADGTRLVCRMNFTHTVGDIRNFINASRPGSSARAYTIGTTFPNRILEDDSVTIKDAGLASSVVVQRWV
ncbi:SEP-domain-containing protein [Sistotremastrum niveocremeum HHB9708]|uniref:SEP-domain-containing protein n=1 Tax=Sistotremastrum niveocremeum HHB9708 TaxID=1314777 RepID=A0A164NG53_9AGAM|nr:SEP-domain-containing protein [Sistotremastrum niveocremeum HHB9708]